MDAKLASRLAWKGQIDLGAAKNGPKMAPRWFPELSCGIFVLVSRPSSGPSWPCLVLSWAFLGPFLGNPRGHLQAEFWAWKAWFGGAKWRKAEMSNTGFFFLKKQRELNVFCQVLGAGNLKKACKVVVWRLCCGLEGLKERTWMPNWLQDWLGRAKSISGRQKMAPRWPQEGFQKYLAGFSPCVSRPLWGHLGAILCYLGPSLAPLWGSKGAS